MQFPNINGATGPTGPTGDTGATGPTGSAVQLRGLQAELLGDGDALIADNTTVIFDTVLNDQSLDISYDSSTGEFTISKAGNYFVSWWVSTGASSLTSTVVFSVAVDGSSFSRGVSPIVTGQVSGSAFVTIGATPATISLINVSGDIVRLADTPVQANIVIYELAV